MGRVPTTIEKIIQQAIPEEIECTKSKIWAKLIVHGKTLEDYSDNATGMNDLQAKPRSTTTVS